MALIRFPFAAFKGAVFPIGLVKAEVGISSAYRAGRVRHKDYLSAICSNCFNARP